MADELDFPQIDITFRAVGLVQNDFDEPVSPDILRLSESQITVDPRLAEGLTGLEPGQSIIVIFVFHRSEGFALRQHPRGDTTRPARGVFALRSPFRPNPVGVSTVEIIAVEDNILRVRGLDALNGSPVLDIKSA